MKKFNTPLLDKIASSIFELESKSLYSKATLIRIPLTDRHQFLTELHSDKSRSYTGKDFLGVPVWYHTDHDDIRIVSNEGNVLKFSRYNLENSNRRTTDVTS